MSEYIANLEKVYAAVVADVLDALGRHNQTLSANVSALTPAGRVCGRVFTGRAVVVEEIPPEPYKLEMQAIDIMKAGDVFVLDASVGRDWPPSKAGCRSPISSFTSTLLAVGGAR